MNNESNQKRKVRMKAAENQNKMYNKNKVRFQQQGYPAEVDVTAKLKSRPKDRYQFRQRRLLN